MSRLSVVLALLLLAGCPATPPGIEDAGTNDGRIGVDADPNIRVTFTQPTAASSVFGTVPIALEINPMTGLRAVDLSINGVVVHRFAMGTPLSVALDSTTFPDGPTTLRAVASFSDGRAAEGSVTVTIANQAPAGMWIDPPGDAQRFVEDGPFEVRARTNGSTNVSRVVIKAGPRVLLDDMMPMGAEFAARIEPTEFYPPTSTSEIAVPLSIEITDDRGQMSATNAQIRLRSRVRWFSGLTIGALRNRPIALRDGGIAYVDVTMHVYVLNADGSPRCAPPAPISSGLAEEVTSGPVLSSTGTRFYVGTNQHLIAVEASNCTVAWASPGTISWDGELAVNATTGEIYGADFQGTFHIINPGSGMDRATARLQDAVGGASNVDPDGATVGRDGTVFITGHRTANEGYLVAYNVAAAPTARVYPSVQLVQGLLATEERIYVGREDGALEEVDLNTLSSLRRFDLARGTSLPLPSRCTPRRLMGGLVATCDRNGVVFAFDLVSGMQRWIYDSKGAHPTAVGPAGANGGGLSVGPDGTVYFGDVLGGIHAIDPTNGEPKWRIALDADLTTGAGTEIETPAAVSASGDTVYFAANEGTGGRIYAFITSE